MSEEEKKLPIVYVGPTSSKLGLVRFSNYKELNKNIQEAITEHPALNLLFVPLEEFRTRAPSIYAGREAVVIHASQQLLKDGVF